MKQSTFLTFILITIVVLAACMSTQTPTEKPVEEENNGTVNGDIPEMPEVTPDEQPSEKPAKTEVQLSDFFFSDGTKAHYKGEGNEFAELDIEVVQVNKHYFVVYENNGGSYLRKIYKVEEHKIITLEEQPVDFEQPLPTLNEIEAMQPIGVYLEEPFTEGAKFGDWTIVQTEDAVETPYKTFEKAIVVEMKEDNFVNRKYFVQGYGEVKRESIMNMGEGEFVVTSSLESIAK